VAGPTSVAFLLAQLGSLGAQRFAELLEEIDLTPPHAGLLRAIAANPGMSQQALAQLMTIVPSRLVALLDELERRRLVERRDHPDDRRVYAVHLSDKGQKIMGEIARIARAHDQALCGALDDKERAQLAGLLGRLAKSLGLSPGIHPGYARLGEGDGPAKKRS
jgi:DNA-binding MarR family transcriptional regulator